MKNIICILALFFFISDCSADARVLEQLRSRSSVKAKARSAVSKHKKLKKKVRQASCISKETKPKAIPVKEIATRDELDIKNDLAYLPNGDEPFTGKHEQYHSNGKKYIEIHYKAGKRDGLLIVWDEYEHKVGQLSYMDGEPLE
jgi:antitoxin component YwqK of YwqJK toxin-antitoxin module